MKITIGIPAFNEAKNIAAIITELKKITDSIVVCDDGSSDLTADISEKLGATVIKHKKNIGYGAAINSIFKKCVEINSDILVTFDADGQHRIVDLEKVLQPIKKNKADIVIGSRFLDNKSDVPNYRTHNPLEHGGSVLISTIKFTSIEHPLKFYGIPSLIFLILGGIFTYSAVGYYAEIGRLNPNLTLIAIGTVLIGIVLLISAILLFSLVNVVREQR